MYDRDMIRRLSEELANETDPERSKELVALLQSVLRDEMEEIKVRMSYLSQRYGAAIADPVRD